MVGHLAIFSQPTIFIFDRAYNTGIDNMNIEQIYKYHKKGLVSLLPGYTAYNGHIFTLSQCKNYNNIVSYIFSNNTDKYNLENQLNSMNLCFKISIGVV